MRRGRILVIVTLCAVLAGLVLTRGAGPTLDALAQTARLAKTALHPRSLLPGALETDPTPAAKHPRPGIAAFLETEGSIFQILVGRDGDGETWSAAVSREE